MKKVKVMFLGERATWNGQIFQLFKSKDGKEHNFTGIRHVYFGDVYEMIDDTLKRRPESVESDWKPTPAEETEYEAQKIVVRAYRQRRQKALVMAKPHADVRRAVELLTPFCRSLSSMELSRFMDWVENECSKGNKKKLAKRRAGR